MVDPKVLEAVRSRLAAGDSEDAILGGLEAEGWSPRDSRALIVSVRALNALGLPVPDGGRQTPSPPSLRLAASGDRMIGNFLGLLLSLIAVAVAVFFKVLGVFPPSWSWAQVGAGVFLYALLLTAIARAFGFAVILFFSLSLALGSGYLVFGIPLLAHAAQERALKSGVAAAADVVATRFVGLINEQGEFIITLRVERRAAPPVAVDVMVFGDGSSQRAPYSVGDRLNVKYDAVGAAAAILGPAS